MRCDNVLATHSCGDEAQLAQNCMMGGLTHTTFPTCLEASVECFAASASLRFKHEGQMDHALLSAAAALVGSLTGGISTDRCLLVDAARTDSHFLLAQFGKTLHDIDPSYGWLLF
jgi:hypothetical protein